MTPIRPVPTDVRRVPEALAAAVALLAGACDILHPPDREGCEARRLDGRPALQILHRPFDGDYSVTNYFDHEIPGGRSGALDQLTFCGTRVPGYVDGHLGYDWGLPAGTPLWAVADGEVITAGREREFLCGSLGMVAGLLVELRHKSPDGAVFVSEYGHLDRVDVQVGDHVSEGGQIGLSGNTGCSSEPHLHFAMWRWVTGGGRTGYVVVDPFGWQAEGPDPWARHPGGTESVWLWIDGQAPKVFTRSF